MAEGPARPLRISQPGTIGPLRLKNRLIMAPMGTNFGTSDGLSTERDRHYITPSAPRAAWPPS